MIKKVKISPILVFVIGLVFFLLWLFGGLIVSAFNGNSGFGSLWIMNVDGSGLQRLTETCSESNPIWSPDSQKILYQYTVGPIGREVGVINVADPRQGIFVVPDIMFTSFAQWSPNGNQIIYVENSSIFYVGVGETPTKIADLELSIEQKLFALSPDGSKLVYIVYTRPDGLKYRTSALLMNVDGSDKKLLLTSIGEVSEKNWNPGEPVWSPNGKYLSLVNFGRSGQTIILEAIGDGEWVQRAIPELEISRFYWSPNGQQAAIMQCLGSSNCLPERPNSEVTNDIFVIDGDGKNRRDIQKGMIELLGWDSQGTGVIYRSLDVGGNSALYRVEQPGADPDFLTYIPIRGSNPGLSPDGDRIVFESSYCGSEEGIKWFEIIAAWRERGEIALYRIFPSSEDLVSSVCFGLLILQSIGSVCLVFWQIVGFKPTSRRYKVFMGISIALTILTWLFIFTLGWFFWAVGQGLGGV